MITCFTKYMMGTALGTWTWTRYSQAGVTGNNLGADYDASVEECKDDCQNTLDCYGFDRCNKGCWFSIAGNAGILYWFPCQSSIS